MKLDRNENLDGRGKYALVLLRRLDDYTTQGAFGALAPSISGALTILYDAGILDFGAMNTKSEFMVIRLRDKWAQAGLRAYADAAMAEDPEYAAEINEMANRSGSDSPFCKKPD